MRVGDKRVRPLPASRNAAGVMASETEETVACLGCGEPIVPRRGLPVCSNRCAKRAVASPAPARAAVGLRRVRRAVLGPGSTRLTVRASVGNASIGGGSRAGKRPGGPAIDLAAALIG